MTGKIRVSIVATALDGLKTENKTVLNMFSRVQNRNSGYSDNLFSQSLKETNTLSSIDGATALKLDESYQLEEQDFDKSIDEVETQPDPQRFQQNLTEIEQPTNELPKGVSIESASYMENNNLTEKDSEPLFVQDNNAEDEHTPKLFSEEQNQQSEEINFDSNDQDNNLSGQLFDQDTNEEEEFEIPAFLRKQKF